MGSRRSHITAVGGFDVAEQVTTPLENISGTRQLRATAFKRHRHQCSFSISFRDAARPSARRRVIHALRRHQTPCRAMFSRRRRHQHGHQRRRFFSVAEAGDLYRRLAGVRRASTATPPRRFLARQERLSASTAPGYYLEGGSRLTVDGQPAGSSSAGSGNSRTILAGAAKPPRSTIAPTRQLPAEPAHLTETQSGIGCLSGIVQRQAHKPMVLERPPRPTRREPDGGTRPEQQATQA